MSVVTVKDRKGGVATAANPSWGEATEVPFSFTLAGALRVGISSLSGTVTADQGAPNTNANRWPVYLSDGSAALLGQKTMAASLPVVIASDQSSIAVTIPSNSSVNVTQWGSTATTLGQKAMTASVPVVIASDQSDIEIVGELAHSDPDSGKPVKIGGYGATTVPTAVAGGDRVNAWFNTIGALNTTIVNNSGDLASVASGGDGLANTNLGLYSYNFNHIYNGSTWDRQRPISNSLDSTGTGITAAGLVAQFDDTTPSTVTENQFSTVRMSSRRALYVEGPLAHDAVDAANPLKIGFKAIAHGANPSAVAADDITHGCANRAGVPWVMGGHPNIIAAEYNTTAAQTDDPIIDSIGAGTKIVITMIDVTADNANTVDVGVRIGFGTATLTAAGASGAAAVNGIVLSHPGIAAGSGVVKGSGSGIVGIGADGEELRITNEVPTTGSLRVQVHYFTIES